MASAADRLAAVRNRIRAKIAAAAQAGGDGGGDAGALSAQATGDAVGMGTSTDDAMRKCGAEDLAVSAPARTASNEDVKMHSPGGGGNEGVDPAGDDLAVACAGAAHAVLVVTAASHAASRDAWHALGIDAREVP